MVAVLPMSRRRKKILQFLFGATEGYNLQRNVKVTILGISLGVIIAAIVGLVVYLVYAHQNYQSVPF
jgi:uncharacterized integral membrane protein